MDTTIWPSDSQAGRDVKGDNFEFVASIDQNSRLVSPTVALSVNLYSYIVCLFRKDSRRDSTERENGGSCAVFEEKDVKDRLYA